MSRAEDRKRRGNPNWSVIRERLRVASEAPQAADRAEDILTERAKRLARPRAAAVQPLDTLEVIQFQLAGAAYAVANARVLEVCRTPPLTPIPGAPPFILGIVNLRGAIYAVNDMAALLGQRSPAPAAPSGGSLLVLGNADMELAVQVDEVIGVTQLPQRFSPSSTGRSGDYLIGITADGVALLNGDRLLSDQNIIVSAE